MTCEGCGQRPATAGGFLCDVCREEIAEWWEPLDAAESDVPLELDPSDPLFSDPWPADLEAAT